MAKLPHRRINMWNLIWPILIVVAANTLYNICTKSTPEDINSFASLFVTYLVASAASLGMFFITAREKNFIEELAKANWTSYILGLVIVGLEFGFIAIYRAGWKISMGSVVANISLAFALVIVGALMYKEQVSLCQIIGVCVCAIGLYLISK